MAIRSVMTRRSEPRRGRVVGRIRGCSRGAASYELNDAAAPSAFADRHPPVRTRQDWQAAQPTAERQNAFLEGHGWEEYAAWHLGLTVGANDETKARYAFVYGDFRRVQRTGLIACVYRASEWRHKAIELAAHVLLQQLDAAAG